MKPSASPRSPRSCRATTRRRCQRRRASGIPRAAGARRVRETRDVGAASTRSAACWRDDVVSPINVPPHDNSAMDGYRLRRRAAARRRADCACTSSAPRSPGKAWQGSVGAGPVREDHDRRDHAGRPRHRRAAGVHARVDGDRIAIPAGVAAARRQPPPRRRRPDAGPARAAARANASARPACGLLASLGIAAGRRCCAACASRTSPPATRSSAWASRSREGAVYDSNRYTRARRCCTRLGVRGGRPRRGARRPGAAGSGASAMPRPRRRRHHHQRRRQRRRGRLHQGDDEAARRRRVLEASRCGRAGRWRSAASARTARESPSCSACPAIRSR